MSVAPDTVVVGVDPDMSRVGWVSSLAGTPAADSADAAFDRIAARRVSLAFCRAVFRHESQDGTQGICAAYNTKSPGNTRSSRTGAGTVLQIPGRGPFVRYDDWPDGWDDLAFRLVDPAYVYAQEGRRTIRQIIERFAPASDDNAPEAYIAAVVRDMNRWEEPPMMGDDPRFEWRPDTSEFGYPQGTRGRNGKRIDYLIVHTTEGTDSLAWLNGGNGSSAHYLTKRDASPRAQMVREADAAWTAGSRDYNERGINVEFERFVRDEWTDAEYRRAAATVYPIAKRNGIPLIYLGRNSGGRRGFIGHADVPDGRGGWGGTTHHTDPGPRFDWQRFMDEVLALDDPAPPVVDRRVFPETGASLVWGFKGLWERAESAGLALLLIGYPLEDERTETRLPGVTAVQRCERAWLVYEPGNAAPWDCHVATIEQALVLEAT